MKKYLFIILSAIILGITSHAQECPKREFRGAWIQCVNGQWIGLGRDRMQQTLTYQLDELQKYGINAIMFQVRAEGDALYESNIEPWSRYLTGRQGQAPDAKWDPLQWMIEQCHKRGMECHAWINPFRAKTKFTHELAANHPATLHPDRFIEYDGLLIFDPGLPENREYIYRVCVDIVNRYDIDGLHMDDYFYPYPVKGLPFHDEASYARYGKGMSLDNWRRENVNTFIRELHHILRQAKPWCKFGVSPFGIYHNERNGNSIPGSDTNGTQNYDDLYADVLLWLKNGWVDYNLPQIYWEIGNKAADYDKLIRWWSRYTYNRPLYIGQDVERTVKHPDIQDANSHQMRTKYALQRSLPGISGSCQWYAKAVVDNPGNYGTMLKLVYHRYPALQPEMKWIDKKAPGKPRNISIKAGSQGPVLTWDAPRAKKELDRAVWYAIYRSDDYGNLDIRNSRYLITVTRDCSYTLPPDAKGHTYTITALDHMQNESKAVKVKL